jgi:hypothetical protein
MYGQKSISRYEMGGSSSQRQNSRYVCTVLYRIRAYTGAIRTTEEVSVRTVDFPNFWGIFGCEV